MKTDQTQPIPAIDHCSVKVMRSHDYCHFEVVLGSSCLGLGDGDYTPVTTAQVDALRKEAARLADKAVEQYKTAKRAAAIREGTEWEREQFIGRRDVILQIPESERTPEQKAVVKKANDDAYWAARGYYDYEDDYEESED